MSLKAIPLALPGTSVLVITEIPASPMRPRHTCLSMMELWALTQPSPPRPNNRSEQLAKVRDCGLCSSTLALISQHHENFQ